MDACPDGRAWSDPGIHGVVGWRLMDQVGWHRTGKPVVPGNISVVALPAQCPEPNPVENFGQFMRDNGLSNRALPFCDTTVGHCCEAGNKLL